MPAIAISSVSIRKLAGLIVHHSISCGLTSLSESLRQKRAWLLEALLFSGGPHVMVKHCSRGRGMGEDLDRISRGLNTKLPVVIVEGKRGQAPMQTATWHQRLVLQEE
ncbi:unnamed protein product [Urochloa humidicola]